MPKERNKADSYREKAYEGDTKAMNNLGVCYERGTGVKVNLEMAFEWYMKVLSKGIFSVRRMWERPIGMVMVWRKTFRSVPFGTNWPPTVAMPRHSLPQDGS